MNILPGSDFSLGLFKNPTNEYDVTYMWFWNVPITRELIDNELSEYLRAGIRSLYIVPLPKDFRPDTIRTFLEPEYLTDGFFDLVEYAVRRAIELGMKPWIYDEGGWPSGGACYHTLRENPNAKLKVLSVREVRLLCDERFEPREGFIALFYKKHRLPDDYIASRDMTLKAYYVEEITDFGNRVDYTNASVTETFINNTYKKYKERLGDLFGEQIPIIFTDEPGLFSRSLADSEFSLFKERFGYDLRDLVYVLEDGGALCETEREIQARIDHGILLGELFYKNTFAPLHDFCEASGIYYSGHLDIDNRPFGGACKGVFSMLSALRNFHVPGVDVIWEQIRYPHGGRIPLDDETRGFGFFPRLASSAARQETRCVAVTESLGIFGDGLTHDEIRYVLNYQLMRGISAMNFAPISIGKSRLACLLTRPNFRPEKPGFYNLRELHEYYARLCYLARLGHADGDTALYMPCRDLAADPVTVDLASAAFKALGTRLEEENIPFDIIDDEGILMAEDTGVGLLLGDALYKNIALPDCRFIPEDVKERIKKYSGVGRPTYSPRSGYLRFMRRILDSGVMWFVFNEGIETVSETLDIAGEYKNVYRLDPRSGEVYSESPIAPTLVAGEVAVYYATDLTLDTVSDAVEYSTPVTSFEPIAHKRFVIEYEGVKNEYGDGSITPDDSFSGEITYRGEYTLPYAPSPDERYRIVLEGFSASASVRLGEHEIPLGMTPMRAIFSGEHLCRSGYVEVTVSNTALNEIYAKKKIIDMHPRAEVGGYGYRMEPFEVRRARLSFGSVTIERLK